jgi:tRNA pseudouridine32 synthase/23S rRNA pseudouridine746 synthase
MPTLQCYTSFGESIDSGSLPDRFTFPFRYEPHPLSIRACELVQEHLTHQNEWQHNFGLSEQGTGRVIGKMFGVLIVQRADGDVGFLSAFSGKIADGYQPPNFVPSIFQVPLTGGFLNDGMAKLGEFNQQLQALEDTENPSQEEIERIKILRKNHSNSLQDKIHDQYHFLNVRGESKSLKEIFDKRGYKNPPGGAGDCAMPKLLQYAFTHHLRPIMMAEFWWGLSPKSEHWKHKHYYPCCLEKCEPILEHMLEGMKIDEAPGD